MRISKWFCAGKGWHRGLILAVMLLAGVGQGVRAEDGKLSIGFDARGLSSLKYGATEYLAAGAFAVSRVQARAADGTLTPIAGARGEKATFDAAQRTATVTGDWGVATCRYAPKPDRLDLEITVTNKGTETLGEVALSLMTLKIAGPVHGGRPAEFMTGIPVTTLQGDNISLALGMVGELAPLEVSIGEGKGKAAGQYTLNLRAGGERFVGDQWQASRPLPPGQSDTYRVSIRLGAPGSKAIDLAEDLCKQVAQAQPMRLNWPDRRPILRTFMGGGLPAERVNAMMKTLPPGTLPAEVKEIPDANLPTQVDPKFRKKIMGNIQRAVDAAKLVDAQGVIIWDIEGTAFPHATTYIGDPRMTRWLNPEMDLLADEAFKMMKDAGLQVGVCIRPSVIVYNQEKQRITQAYGPAKDPLPALDAKIKYAKERWGCRLFYIDTSVFCRPPKYDGRVIPPMVWKQLLEKYPDTLFIPEFNHPLAEAFTAEYGEADMGNWGVEPAIRKAWPQAFRVIVIEDADPGENFDRFVNTVRQGNVLMTHGLGGSNNVLALKRIYDEAKLLGQPTPAAVQQAKPADLPTLVKSPDMPTRYWAAAGLAKDPTPASVQLLRERMMDEKEDWLVRKRALVSLGECLKVRPETGVIPDLLQLASVRPAGFYGFATDNLVILGKDATQYVLEALRQVVGKGASANYPALCNVLKRTRDMSAAAPLKVMIEDAAIKDYRLKGELLRTLGVLGGAEAEALVLKLYADTPELKRAAIDALGALGTPKAVEQLRNALAAAKKDNDKDMVRILGEALKEAEK